MLDEAKKQKIIGLIEGSNILNAQEKADWLALLDLMNDKQIAELEEILKPTPEGQSATVNTAPEDQTARPQSAPSMADLAMPNYAQKASLPHISNMPSTLTDPRVAKTPVTAPRPSVSAAPVSAPPTSQQPNASSSPPVRPLPQQSPSARPIASPGMAGNQIPNKFIPPKPLQDSMRPASPTVAKTPEKPSPKPSAPLSNPRQEPRPTVQGAPSQPIPARIEQPTAPGSLQTVSTREETRPSVPFAGLGGLPDISGLTSSALHSQNRQAFFEQLLKMAGEHGYFKVLDNLEHSSLYQDYLAYGKAKLSDPQAETNLSQEEFEFITDILLALKINRV